MFYFKLRPKISSYLNNEKTEHKATTGFGIPSQSKFYPNLQLTAGQPAKMQFSFSPGSNIEADEHMINIKNGEEFTVKTNLSIERWTGMEFWFQLTEGCTSSGQRVISFELVEVLTQEEYNDSKKIN